LAGAIVSKYRDQRIGVADASNVVLADRYRRRTIVTLEHRHFNLLRPMKGAVGDAVGSPFVWRIPTLPPATMQNP
jgi:hypothetical protein